MQRTWTGEAGLELSESETRTLAIRNDRALARARGLQLVAFEGGQHFTGSRFTRDEVNVHPDMAKLYKTLFDGLEEEGGGRLLRFASVIPRGSNEPGEEPTYFQSENFGIKELKTQALSEAPKWRAVVETMKKIGQRR